MKRTALYLMAIAAIMIAAAAAQPEPDRDEEPPWLVQINLMQWGAPSPVPLYGFSIMAGDWVELYAQEGGFQDFYKIELEIQGEAVEKFASVRTATLLRSGGNPTQAIPTPAGPAVRRIYLRGKKPGTATIKTTVSKGRNWKETREIEVTVTKQRHPS